MSACGVGTPRATRRRCASMCAAFVTSSLPLVWPMIPIETVWGVGYKWVSQVMGDAGDSN